MFLHRDTHLPADFVTLSDRIMMRMMTDRTCNLMWDSNHGENLVYLRISQDTTSWTVIKHLCM